MDFHGLNINDRLKRSLSETVDSGRLPHAIILEGGNANARVKLARLLAASLVCTSPVNRPCKTCPQCKKAFGGAAHATDTASEKLNHPDIIEVTKEANKAEFGVTPIRALRSEAYIVPNEAQAKVFILIDAHLLNRNAQNAFLKILEEPPAYICFILECTNKNVLLPTVLSRAISFSLGQLEQGEGIKPEKLVKAQTAAAAIAGAVTAPNEFELMKNTAVLEKDKELLRLCLSELELIFRDACVLRFGGGTTISSAAETAAALSRNVTKEKLIRLTQEIKDLTDSVNKNANSNLLITRLCSKLRA